jgi:hypothetical protein
MAEAGRRRIWAKRLSSAAGLLSVGAVAAALIGAVGSGQEWWHFRIGFQVLRYSAYAAAAGGVLALLGLLVAGRRAPRLMLLNLLFLLIAGAFCFYLYSQYRSAMAAAPIHDVTTNIGDSPAFRTLRLREDNLADIPSRDRADLEALEPRERWAALHREAYGDLRTLSVPWTVAETIRRAEALARERGWEVATADPRGGLIEATETSRFFRFKDDVVLRVRAAPGGNGSLVDMRSVSRVGVSDVGVNARRSRSFLADLQED